MKKRNLTVTLTERVTGHDGHTGKEMKIILAKDGSKLLGFLPYLVFVIAKDKDARLHAKGTEILILFNGKDTHCGNCPSALFLWRGNLFIIVKLLNAAFFFKEAFQPKLSVGMSAGEHFVEQRQAVPMEVDGTD